YFTRLYLQNGILTKIDRASMLNSLEVRSPFLDIDLIDYVSKLSFSLKFKNGNTKYILKKAAEVILPKEIIYRKKKGFGAPIGKWFKNGSIKSPSGFNGLNPQFIVDCHQSHVHKKINFKEMLWYVHVLSQWNT
ncbi:MAG: asparagine synthase-related protein, partial [Methylococcaceae bacterium]